MKRYGIVDIGSNTVRLEIYCDKGKDLIRFFKKKENLGLTSYIENGVISDKGISRLIEILSDYVNISKNIRIEDLFIFATAAIRNSKNVNEILKKIKDSTGIEVDLLSGNREAELGFKAVTETFGITSGLNVDIGGGSTEFTLFDDGIVKLSKSMNNGSLSFFSNCIEGIIPTKKEAKLIKKEVKNYMKSEGFSKNVRKQITGVGGTIRILGRLIREYYNLGFKTYFNVEELKTVVNKLIEQDKATIRMLLQLSPDRIHTIVPGALILLTICDYFSVEEILVSESGVRTGYLLEKLQK